MKRIEEGIKWLDGSVPNWYKKIDIEKLDMEDGKYCILGQATGIEYNEIATIVWGTEQDKSWVDPLNRAEKLGFGSDAPVKTWIKVIVQRRQQEAHDGKS